MPVVQLRNRPAVPVAIAEHGPPEGQHLGNVERVDSDHDVLHLRWFGPQPQLLGCGGDPPGQLDVAAAEPVRSRRGREQPHEHAIRAQVEVGRVIVHAWKLGDCLYEAGARGKGPVGK
jgi:hypothetical protein